MLSAADDVRISLWHLFEKSTMFSLMNDGVTQAACCSESISNRGRCLWRRIRTREMTKTIARIL